MYICTSIKYTDWAGWRTEQTPLWIGTALPEVAAPERFGRWDCLGISTLGDVTRGGHLQTFADIREDHGPLQNQFYTYNSNMD